MAVEAALPSSAWNADGAVLTFIVPAIGGCDLACPYCFIDQRKEKFAAPLLKVDQYTKFIRQVSTERKLAAISIQGYEPLLPHSFPYSRAILSTGQWLNIATSLVTNGTHLALWVDELSVLAPGRISVSLDAAEAEAHDRQRRKQGAFDQTVDGLRKAVNGMSSETELVVTSVLIPKRRNLLDTMPELLKDIGIKRWVVTALQKVGKDRPGGPVGEREKTLTDLRILRDRAEAKCIEFRVDDEFAGLGDTNECPRDNFEKNRIRRLINPDGVYRLVPDGRCSKGTDILKPLNDQTPRWDPQTVSAGDFIRSLG